MSDEQHVLDPTTLNALLDEAIEEARRRSVKISVAVVDAGGHLLRFSRMSGVHFATVDVAQAKARSAAAFRRPTRDFADQLAHGNLSLLAVPGCVPLPGGIPLLLDGRTIGAVGISGAPPDVDEAIAQVAVESVNRKAGAV